MCKFLQCPSYIRDEPEWYVLLALAQLGKSRGGDFVETADTAPDFLNCIVTEDKVRCLPCTTLKRKGKAWNDALLHHLVEKREHPQYTLQGSRFLIHDKLVPHSQYHEAVSGKKGGGAMGTSTILTGSSSSGLLPNSTTQIRF
ncbi:hypothetical protein TNCV_4592451 [Trichonephila clavipes]|nr:hypothetical protein TNCV_4592451 [Trichonephila clavipes]